jgi:S-DNA-T family DNA segregation ATPase FtsK/SpoIIIE
MLFLWPGTSTLLRGQGTYLSDEEIERIVESVSTGEQHFVHELVNLKVTTEGEGAELGQLKSRDELYEAAVDIVIREGRGSVSLLQRSLGIGYGRAARLIDYMAEDGIVGPYAGSQAREVTISIEQWEAMQAGQQPATAASAPAPVAPARPQPRKNKIRPEPDTDREADTDPPTFDDDQQDGQAYDQDWDEDDVQDDPPPDDDEDEWDDVDEDEDVDVDDDDAEDEEVDELSEMAQEQEQERFEEEFEEESEDEEEEFDEEEEDDDEYFEEEEEEEEQEGGVAFPGRGPRYGAESA